MASRDAALEPGFRRAPRGLTDLATLGRLLLFALGVVAIWAAPRPLMIDLPQHAGQVALLHDLVLGRSPWAGEIHVNLFTPYLIGYGLALPLSFVMSAAAALKVVLTAAYAAFIGACIGVRRELGASPRLDAYYAFSFFGFAYAWGMYTFLVAAPLGVAFIWLCIRYARTGLARQGLGLAALGLGLLFSHGLVFLFACGVGGFILLVQPGLAQPGGVRRLLLRSWPFWILLSACAAFFVLTREREAAITRDFGAQLAFGPWQAHFVSVVFNAFDAPNSGWPALCFPVFAGLPLLAGFRPDWRAREAVVIAAGALAVVVLAPHYAWSTSMLFERFALFLPPAYAWLLRERPPAPASLAARLQPRLGLWAGLACAAVLAQHARLSFEFGREQRDFEGILAAAAPGQRALALIFDPSSEVDHNADAYLHHALWYQAERGGFVDFNFAAFHPQIARFRPGRVPPVDEYVAQNPARFDWRADGGDRYRFFFVRSAGAPPASIFAGSPCPPAQVAASGEWRLYERRACPPGPKASRP
ncbi:MAG: hypothetical protein JWP73_1501 [Phenylobacterium sp.]|nr:hypothetical protein [Phenylobacterium sp.]